MTKLAPVLAAEIQQGYRDFLAARDLKPRLGQRQMIAHIANSLNQTEQRICVIEAGTGTGKTMSYLLAALPMAKQAGKRVVIATGTISLQEQLLDKDLPELIHSTGWDYRYALVKGRARYVCNLRLQQCLDAAKAKDGGLFLYADELPFMPGKATETLYKAFSKALESGEWQGDKDSWPDAIADDQWQPLTVDRRQCSGRRCRYIRECAFYKAREDVDEADVIIANHDIVMADLSLGGGAILPAPEETLYIFDEGHRLGETGVRHFAAYARIQSTLQWLNQLEKPLNKVAATLSVDEYIGKQLNRVAQQIPILVEQFSCFYPLIKSRFTDMESMPAGSRYRFPEGDVGDDIRLAAEDLQLSLTLAHNQLDMAADRVNDALNDPNYVVPKVELEMVFPQLGTWLSRLENLIAVFQRLSQPVNRQMPQVCWLTLVEGQQNQLDIGINISPILAANLLEKHLWSRCYGAVVTSATLRSLGNFERFIQAAGTPEEISYQAVAGAFDYQNKARLFVPKEAIDGKDAELHTQQVIKQLPALLKQFDSALVLFASRKQMEAVYQGLSIAQQHQILVQGDMSHRETLRLHKERIDDGERSALFGLASFAEGLDLPGKYCQHVIIAKLPFAVPDDPLQEALSEWLEAQGGNAFFQLSLPDASLKLIQASGRLLRTEEDQGQVTILDRRIVSKRYGLQLLDALPPFQRCIE